ncbi:SAG-related sequence [Besnoitia besnoiti]|uniref:SAG-related sequence n=1 Tax=Besnoitia besnoiti TaxID=94643 RepID=A0A2A9MKV2_BESBE|nr:SAG-related sequence [Besnoitia besnoiti]PFH36257.1 SAG-related sequence [Besnoitia besnoiti]
MGAGNRESSTGMSIPNVGCRVARFALVILSVSTLNIFVDDFVRGEHFSGATAAATAVLRTAGDVAGAPGICKKVSDGVTSCTCAELSRHKATGAARGGGGSSGGEPASADIVFDGDNTLTLTCSTPTTIVPPSLHEDNLVCLSGAEPSKCKTKDESTGSVGLQTLLEGEGSESVKWIKTKDEYALAVPRSAAPLSDKSFWVGCLSQQPTDKAACKITVALKAKESTTIDGNVVRCAYGATSNEKGPQKVTLSPKANSLTLVCGSEGAIQPTTYNEHFCSGQISDNCSDAYTAVLPDFQKDWWTPDSSGKTPYKLVIPEDKFPQTEQMISLGCKYAAAPAKATSEHDEPEPTVSTSCRVDVTIAAAGSSSSAAVRDWRMLFGVSGFIPLLAGILSMLY